MIRLTAYWRAALLTSLVLCGCANDTNDPETAAAQAQAALTGQWQLVNFPSITIAAALLPNGKIITWSSDNRYTFSDGLGQTYTSLFDPATLVASDVLVSNTSHDMFCPGASMLPDGRVFVNGGGTAVRNTSLYNFSGGTWDSDALMNQPRWYNSSVTLPNGDVFTLGGNLYGGLAYNGSGERWTAGQGWSAVPGALLDPLVTSDPVNRSQEHPRMFVAPNGKVFISGPTPNMQWYDLSGNGSIQAAGTRGNDTFSQNDTTVMFDQGKLLKAGGNVNYDRTNAAQSPSSATAYVIDINSDTAQVHQVASMVRGRAFCNGVVLPDGEVLVVGGLDNGKAFTDVGAVLTPELWNPATETWSDVSPMSTARTYHSVALLMPDGRVFAGGGGQCGQGCAANHFDAEIFSPAYLFQGGRPAITSAPSSADYASQINVGTTGTVSGFAWIRMYAVTHSINTDQRRLSAVSTANGNGAFTITTPANANLAPPGYYMLFALNGGIPSVAQIIRIGAANQTPAGTNVALQRPATQSSTFNGRAASIAVDGVTLDTSEANVSHTNSDAQAWWQVDLGSVQAIGRVNVWNRVDCCSDRLTNFDVKLSTDGSNWTSTINVPGQAGSPTSIDFGGQNGRYVRVQLRGTGFLSLTEVQVFASGGGSASSDTVCTTVPEYPATSTTLACPKTGEVITSIDFASWGTPGGSCGNFSKGSCDAASSSQIVSSACLGQASCVLPINNTTFGDPCSGTGKTFEAQVTCGAGQTPPPSDVACASVGESDTATLSCPAGEVITGIDFASYGTPQGACRGFALGTCNAAGTTQVVSNNCLGRASCAIAASNATFGDPCSGTYKSFDVQVRCAASQTPPPSDIACVTTAYEGGTAALACPAGETISGVDFASYGTPTGGCGSFAASSCNAANANQVVSSACVGKASCMLPVSNASFGDPCSGTYKWLNAQVRCSAGQSTVPSDVVCASVNENETATITCASGEVVRSVDFASYGTPAGACGSFAGGACNAATSSSVVTTACLGKASCTVPATNAKFGDPCSGTYKGLAIQVGCAP
jgi:hypothetical protein